MLDINKYKMNRQDIIDYFDHGRKTNINEVSIKEIEETKEYITNKNKVDIYLYIRNNSVKQIELEGNIKGVFNMGYLAAQKVYYSPIIPGTIPARLYEIGMFEKGLYPRCVMTNDWNLIQMVSYENEKDDYYTMMNKLEVLSHMVMSNMSRKDLDNCPDFILALHHFAKYFNEHRVWNIEKQSAYKISSTRESYLKTKKYLDDKKASYPTSCVGMNCVEKYCVLTMTIRRSFNNPPLQLLYVNNYPKIFRYLLVYCKYRTLSKLDDSRAITTKLLIPPYTIRTGREDMYSEILVAVTKYSVLPIIRKYVYKVSRKVKKQAYHTCEEHKINHKWIIHSMWHRFMCENDNVDILKLYAESGLLQYLLVQDVTGYHKRYLKYIKKLCFVNDINLY
jgi:hypothetical protein